MRRRIHVCRCILSAYEEEDTCMSYEEEDTCMSMYIECICTGVNLCCISTGAYELYVHVRMNVLCIYALHTKPCTLNMYIQGHNGAGRDERRSKILKKRPFAPLPKSPPPPPAHLPPLPTSRACVFFFMSALPLSLPLPLPLPLPPSPSPASNPPSPLS